MKRDHAQIRQSLIDARNAVLRRFIRLQEDWRNMPRKAIEPEEDAQLLRSTELLDRLDDRSKLALDTIDLALARLTKGSYGRCEDCGRAIGEQRLEAMPEARLCVSCAEEYEMQNRKLAPAGEIIEQQEISDEHRGADDGELRESIALKLVEDGRLDLDELSVTVAGGVVYLDGIVPNSRQHSILLKTLRDVMGFTAVVDRLKVDESEWEGRDESEEITFDRKRERVRRRVAHEEEELTSDPLEYAVEETPPLIPSDKPPPDPYHE